RRRDVVGAAVMADIGDETVALLVDGRLVGAACLQVAPAGQLHVGGLGRRADLLLRRRRKGEEKETDPQPPMLHGVSPWLVPIIRPQPWSRPAIGTLERSGGRPWTRSNVTGSSASTAPPSPRRR